jgi:hypothetical protein
MVFKIRLFREGSLIIQILAKNDHLLIVMIHSPYLFALQSNLQ